jgi:hypothetical protein
MNVCCEMDIVGPPKYRRWLQRAYWVLAAIVVITILFT